MRIAGNIEHPRMKITILEMNNRLAVKFETAGLEQTYKFEDSPASSSVGSIKDLIDQTFLSEVEMIFNRMIKLKVTSVEKKLNFKEEEFDDII